MDEIDRVGREGVTVDEVARAKRQMEVSLINHLTTNHSVANRIGQEIVTFGRVRPLSERVSAIRAVTPEDVQRVVKTYLKPESRSVIRVISPPDPEPDSSVGAPGSAAERHATERGALFESDTFAFGDEVAR